MSANIDEPEPEHITEPDTVHLREYLKKRILIGKCFTDTVNFRFRGNSTDCWRYLRCRSGCCGKFGVTSTGV